MLSNIHVVTNCPIGLPDGKQVDNCERFSVGHRNFLATIAAASEPQSFKAAMKDPGWQEAMQLEIQALENNGTGV